MCRAANFLAGAAHQQSGEPGPRSCVGSGLPEHMPRTECSRERFRRVMSTDDLHCGTLRSEDPRRFTDGGSSIYLSTVSVEQ